MSTNCKNCGNILQGGEKFCSKCGAPIEESAATKENIDIDNIVGKVSKAMRPLSRYFVAAYMVGYLIIIMLTGRAISEYLVSVAVAGLSGLGVAGVITFLLIGALAWGIDWLRKYCYKEDIHASELWLFGIKPNKRWKISMILLVISWISKVIAIIMLVVAIVPVFKIYGISWMLLIQTAEPLTMFLFADLMKEWSTAIDVGVAQEEKSTSIV